MTTENPNPSEADQDQDQYDPGDDPTAHTPVCPDCETPFHRVLVFDPEREEWEGDLRCGACTPPRTLHVPTVVAESFDLAADSRRIEAYEECVRCGGTVAPTSELDDAPPTPTGSGDVPEVDGPLCTSCTRELFGIGGVGPEDGALASNGSGARGDD